MKQSIIPYGKQEITSEDIISVIDALTSDFLTQGPKIMEFEENFASYIGVKYAIAVSNGTAALHLSMLALNLQKGDKVITSPLTFAASANCIRYCNGEVIFSDIDPESYLLDLESVRTLLKSSPKGSFKGIIVVDFAGRAVNLEGFRLLAEEYKLWIVEDACHAPGAYFIDSYGNKQKSGNGNFAELSVFSFHPVKHIACGEGGMITTNDERLYHKLLKLRSHGISRDQDTFLNSKELAVGEPSEEYPLWYMEMQELGFNYRLTDFQAALGISQLKRAEANIDKRKVIAKRYNDAFEKLCFIKGHSKYLDGHAYHLYVIHVENRLGLYNFLRQNNIFAQIHYFPCHLMPYYQRLGWKQGDFEKAEEYYKNCISIPMYPTLKTEEQECIIQTIINYYS